MQILICLKKVNIFHSKSCTLQLHTILLEFKFLCKISNIIISKSEAIMIFKHWYPITLRRE